GERLGSAPVNRNAVHSSSRCMTHSASGRHDNGRTRPARSIPFRHSRGASMVRLPNSAWRASRRFPLALAGLALLLAQLLAVTLHLAVTPRTAAAQDEPQPTAKSPEASLASIKVRPGFKVELMASEPLVFDPVAFAFGADGKLWVVEMGDYPLGAKTP